ncbi:MAG: leucine-rich repeat protein [Rikenellaceae bacterium]
MKKNLILGLLFVVLTSCNKEVTEPLTEPFAETTTVSLTASLVDAETRVSADTSSDDEWSFAWDTEDEISAWYTNCTGVNQFSMDTYDEQSSTFTGDIVTDADNHRFIYPYEEGVEITNGCYPIDITGQNGELNKTYFINDTQIATTSLVDNTVSALSMKHLGAFMVVDIYLEDYAIFEVYTIESVTYKNIHAKAVVDMTKDYDSSDLYTSEIGDVSATDINVAFSPVVGSNGAYRQAITRLNILPFDVEAGGSLTIDVVIGINGTDTKEFSITIQNTSEATVSFARATHNYTYLTISNVAEQAEITGATINGWGEIVEVEESLATRNYKASEIDASYVPTGTTWVITDEEITDYTGIKAAITAANTDGREILLVFPNLTSIVEDAFYTPSKGYGGIFSIQAPKVKTIEDETFYSCIGLTSAYFPSVENVGDYAFHICWCLESVELPNATTIGSYAFSKCYVLETMDFPNVTNIGESAFINCASLKTVNLTTESPITCGESILGTVTSSPYPTLYVHSNNKDVANLTGESVYWGEIIYLGAEIGADDISASNVPDGDTWMISDEEITDYTGIKEAITAANADGRDITLYFSNLTSIVSVAFGKYSGSFSVVAPNVKIINESAFYYCTSLKSISCPIADAVGQTAFVFCSTLSEVELPNVKILGGMALSFCTSLESVELPSVINIGEYAFYGCEVLKDVSLTTENTITCDVSILINVTSSPTLYVHSNNKNVTNLTDSSVGWGSIIYVDEVSE